MNINAVNFTGLLQYTEPEAKIATTIDTNNILGIQQKEDGAYPDETQILIKNTHSNSKQYPYTVISTQKLSLKQALIEYNKACRNELGDLGRVSSMEYIQNRKEFVV